ncbi:MAG TPA: PQQ-binding-like beta-propeller repeat protein, partial [Fimbriimonas sp.]|nr:PQQ-binding-like beta-propeller repeat protein [Fimbriimonas sp.]
MSKKTMKGILCAITVGLVMTGYGQSATDHPTLKGNNARTGVNGDVANSGPGSLRNQVGNTSSSSLRWFNPFVSQRSLDALRLNEVNPFKAMIDNTDDGLAAHVDAGGNPVGPYDPLPNGVVASTGTWISPLESEEAENTKTVPIRRNVNPANVPPFDQRNYNPRFASHLWAATTASSGGVGQDPRVGIVPANVSTFSWVFSPRTSTLVAGNFVVGNDPVAKGYALYVWIPEGLVRPGGVERPKLRYWAYEITYGIGQKYVDVVDTFASGTGWVRLGNNGRPTNQLFYYAGLDGFGNPYPITIKLYNTITRDTQDQLTEVVNGANPDNRFSVYADAALFSAETDSYSASPTSAGFGGADIRVVGAKNTRTVDLSTMPAVNSKNFKAKPATISKGIVSSYDYNTGNLRWTYNLVDGNEGTSLFEDTNVRVTPTAGFTPAVDNPNAQGGAYLKGTAGPNPTENVTIDPDVDLADGSYEIFMWVGGDQSPNPVYAKTAKYEIFEGGVSAGVFTLDMSQPAAWVRLGNRRFAHSTANRLSVVMSNESDTASDAGKSVYVDQFMFVGSTGTDIKSTPIHARAFVRQAPGAIPVETDVVIVADEGGRIRCLDAVGNGDGTTNCYWTYPSVRTNVDDPNLQPGQDPTDPNNGTFQNFDGFNDTLQATMPTDFDLSTGVVQRLTVTTGGGPEVKDYLIIGSKNGRVLSIDMAGRGDFNFATDIPGTTYRAWTYPPTYPAANPQTSRLGQVSSVISANLTIAGNPTDVVIVATEQGRLFCLEAIGDFNYTSGSELTTDVIWQYPPATSETLPAIYGAPTLDIANGRVFFGTIGDDGNPSRFMALDATNGTPLWATANNSIVDGLANPPEQLDWLSGPAYVPATQLNSLPSVAAPMPDTVYALNQNGYIYAINAATGDVIWRTDELQSGGLGSLIYTEINTFGPTGATAQYPVIMVGTSNGRFAGLFARLGEETRFGNRVAWGYEMDSSIEASMTSSNKWLYGATSNGYLLAWSDLLNAGSTLPDGFNGPGNETAADNDTSYDSYRNCEIAFLSRTGFQTLRRTLAGTTTGTENFGTVIDGAGVYTKPLGRVRPPYRSTHGAAYEWGETIYLIAYNFPAPQTDGNGNDVPPPVVEATVTTGGRSRRPITAEARLFADKTSADADGGYAIFAIPLTAGGESSYAPGPGHIRVQLRTSATNGNGTMQSISLNPATSQLDYAVANPLAISVETVFGTDPTSTLGYTNDPTREDALSNGSKSLNV